tara:strand:- start:321 stop:1349 length:1029 start_codon:yes stop_codon:yes gene_type:complete
MYMSLNYKLGIYIINKKSPNGLSAAEKAHAANTQTHQDAMETVIPNELVDVNIVIPSSDGKELLEGKTKNQLLEIILKMEELCFYSANPYYQGEYTDDERIGEAFRITDEILIEGNNTEALFLVQVFKAEKIIDSGMATLQFANQEGEGGTRRFWVNEVCRGVTSENKTRIKSEHPGSPSPVNIAMDMLHQYLKNIRFNIPNKEDYTNISEKERGNPTVNLMVKHTTDGLHKRLQNYYYQKYGYEVSHENQNGYNFMRKRLGGGRRKKTRKHRRKNKRATRSGKKKGGSYGELSESALKRMSSYARREKTRRAKLRKLRWSKGLTRRGKPRKRTKSKNCDRR